MCAMIPLTLPASDARQSSPTVGRPRVLQVAYACVPDRGSEPGTGWNHAVEAAKEFDVWVICEGNASETEISSYFKRHDSVPSLHFEFLPESLLESTLKKIPGIEYLAYRLWNRRAGRLAKRLHEEHDFALVHQVTFTGFREPGYLWQLDAPFVWGPIGGAQNYPWRFLGKGGVHAILKEGGRSILNTLQMWFSPRVRLAAQRATCLLTATTTNYRTMVAAHGVTPTMFPDTGVRSLSDAPSRQPSHKSLRMLWCGVLSPHKALHLLIEALGQLPDDLPWELHVVGSGPLQPKWERLARTHGVNDHISWLGWVPHREALSQFAWADVFVFTSLRDTTGTVLPEALAAGLPIVCLDHQGAADVVDDSCGIKVAVTRPKKVIADLSRAIERLSREPETRKALARGASRRAKHYLWPEQGKRMAEVYRGVIADSNGSQPGDAEAEATPATEQVDETSPPHRIPEMTTSSDERQTPGRGGGSSAGLAPEDNERRPDESQQGRLGRLWRSSGQTGFLGLVDQAVVSAVRFATTVAVGRICGATELGAYTLAFSLMLVLMNVQDSAVLGPFVIYSNRLKGEAKSRYAGSVLCQALILIAIAALALAGVAAAFAVTSADSALTTTVSMLAVAIPFVLLHQFGRRFALAELDMRTVILLDLLATAVQVCGFVLLALTGGFSAAAVYAVLGLACALPGIGWLLLRRQSFLIRKRQVPADLKRNWRVGRWMLASQLTATLSGFAGAWLLALLLSVEMAGIYGACVSIVCLTNPVLLGLGNVLMPRTARAFGEGGHAEVRRVSRESMALLGSLTAIGTAILAVFGHSILAILFGSHFAEYHLVITVLALGMLLNAVAMAATHALLALERSDLTFVAQFIGAGVTCLSSLLFIAYWGIYGAAFAAFLGTALTATFVIAWRKVLTAPDRVARRRP
jgi:O-antigen/teichoic acid export membrane protein/glycosyltransferase involved in cell wall biosynthesis